MNTAIATHPEVRVAMLEDAAVLAALQAEMRSHDQACDGTIKGGQLLQDIAVLKPEKNGRPPFLRTTRFSAAWRQF
jgi:hypothetical protein